MNILINQGSSPTTLPYTSTLLFPHHLPSPHTPTLLFPHHLPSPHTPTLLFPHHLHTHSTLPPPPTHPLYSSPPPTHPLYSSPPPNPLYSSPPPTHPLYSSPTTYLHHTHPLYSSPTTYTPILLFPHYLPSSLKVNRAIGGNSLNVSKQIGPSVCSSAIATWSCFTNLSAHA